ncbi:hypothetical protein CEP54_014968 [Fusarium duplospermum]|uniref:Uncharacterized protein n=1 Tax=Fusarium duplospermum TaxID=1325734 RepID=A0A428NSJ4_9HYPO|nr:hypothetical protein CEP54_014968 [Fusarium duplospermum]
MPTAANRTETRRPYFLDFLDDREYYEVYNRTVNSNGLRFPDVHLIANLTREEGKTLPRVMEHIVAWLNAKPVMIKPRRHNKSPLRNDLVEALEHCSVEDVRSAEERLEGFEPANLGFWPSFRK